MEEKKEGEREDEEEEEEKEKEEEASTGINVGVAEFDWLAGRLAGWLIGPSLICRRCNFC
jgi:hypothetical protein